MSSAVDIVYTPNSDVSSFADSIQFLKGLPRAEVSVLERIAALSHLSTRLMDSSDPLRRQLPQEGLAFLTSFLAQKNLKSMLLREVGNLASLDQFLPISSRKSLRMVPRGIVAHWVAGNVPLLAVFSWVISAILGNRNLLRLSGRQGDIMSPLLKALSTVSPAGKRIANETVVVFFDRENTEAHELMSSSASVRIAWGGRDAVDAIRDLPTDWRSEDIVFGPRMSMAVVDPAVTTSGAVKRLATDIVVFDQLACSSPQYVFVKNRKGDRNFERFLEEFSAAFSSQSHTFKRHPLDFSETYQISMDRARAILEGARVVHDRETQWTIAITSSPLKGVDCANRYAQIIPYEQLLEIYPHIPLNVQTCVTSLNKADSAVFTETAAQLGVCRFPKPGEGNYFENPWDGVGLVSRLTRSVTRTDTN